MSFNYRTKLGVNTAVKAKEKITSLLEITAPGLNPRLADQLVDELIEAAVAEALYVLGGMMNKHISEYHEKEV